MRVRCLFVSILFIFFSFTAFSEGKVNFFTNEMAWSIENSLSFENGSDFDGLTAAVDLSAELNMKELVCNFGNKFQAGQVDVTTEAIYWPTLYNRFNVGAGNIFHFIHYGDTFVELDYLFGFYGAYHTEKKFDCMLNLLYHGKAARIFAIKDQVPWLTNNSFAFKTQFNFRPVDPLLLSLSISSYSQYRYMLFFAPDFCLGAEYKCLDMFAFGGQVEIQYIDMFTLSSNLNSIDIRIFAKLEF